jgi:hypothetical protein
MEETGKMVGEDVRKRPEGDLGDTFAVNRLTVGRHDAAVRRAISSAARKILSAVAPRSGAMSAQMDWKMPSPRLVAHWT